ncbi:hypothetical protein GWI33_014358 [Rhynchophorus ferrugineus]|uniref:Gustatory receptor n=1 Tax=Rhynchophorus ferrugineus TaxID=354439 RepID=A0A834MAR3_RHYFE|nr:hypothetical protein GWI33_014358 [Rhynchophorus ferrugineus]
MAGKLNKIPKVPAGSCCKMFLSQFMLKTIQVAPAKTDDKRGKIDDEGEKNIFVSLKSFMTFCQLLGLLPQENVRKSLEEMHFRLLSIKTLYAIVMIFSLTVAVVSCLIFWVMNGSNIGDVAVAVFYGGSLGAMVLHLQLAASWKKLIKSWCDIDTIMNSTYGYPKSLDKKIRWLSFVFIFLGLTDYLLNVGNWSEHLSYHHGDNFTIELYYRTTFPQLFNYLPYNPWSVIFSTIITIHSNVTWAVNDLFIIIMSTALALRFQQISQKLNNERFKINPVLFWKGIREDYDRLASFCRELDSHISPIVLWSFFLNIFFLLIQLYNSLESISLLARKVYFVFSFVYLIFKTTSVSLFAAWINDESKAPTNVLNSVDSALYNVEIRRLLVQISFDKTALTGCKMFSVKRGIILSVASAIVTYELVLIQFSQANLYEATA